MKTEKARTVAMILSIVGALVVFALFVHVSYAVALAQGEPPFSMFGELGFWPVYWLVVLAGLAGVWHGLARRPDLRLAACALYAVAMPIALFVVGLLVGCANGDRP